MDKGLGLSKNIPVVLEGLDINDKERLILEKWGVGALKEIGDVFAFNVASNSKESEDNGVIRINRFADEIVKHVAGIEAFFEEAAKSDSSKEGGKNVKVDQLEQICEEVYRFLDQSKDVFLTYVHLLAYRKSSFSAYIYFGAVFYIFFYRENFLKRNANLFIFYILCNLGFYINLTKKQIEKEDIWNFEKNRSSLALSILLVEKKIDVPSGVNDFFIELKDNFSSGKNFSEFFSIIFDIFKMVDFFSKKLFSLKGTIRYSAPKIVKEVLDRNGFDQKLKMLFLKTFSRYPNGSILQIEDGGSYVLVVGQTNDPYAPVYCILRDSALKLSSTNKIDPMTFSVNPVIREEIMLLVDKGAVTY